MALLDTFLAAPSIRSRLTHIAGPCAAAPLRQVVLAEDVSELERTPADALVILSHAVSADVTGYRLDLAMRLAGSRHAAAVVLTDGRDAIPHTAASIADRVGLAVLRAEADSDLADLVMAAERELGGGADASLERVDATLAALEQAEAADCAADELLTIARDASGGELELRMPADGEISAAVLVDDDHETSVCAPPAEGHAAVATRVIVALTASSIGRARSAARRAADAPIRSRSELLTEFLLAPPDASSRLLPRMRAVDLAVDGWHVAVRIEIDNLAQLTGDDELRSFQLAERIGRLGLEAAHAQGGIWHRAQLGSALMLIRMDRHDPGPRSRRELSASSEQIVRRILSRMGEIRLVCGVGTVHVGANGLRTTAAEARAAVAAGRAANRFNLATRFDEVGLQRTLLEWFASDAAREAVDSLLKPLDRLGDRKRDTAIETLKVYLDTQGSLARTAERMHLHRNAVAYRVRRIFEQLEVDPADPDTRLMLQLACRARSLG